MPANEKLFQVELAGVIPATLGESPLWDVATQSLFYVDIAERQVLCLDPASGGLRRWQLDSEPGCIAWVEGGGLLVAQRNGLWRLDPDTGAHVRLAAAPFDGTKQRFNDGKPDAQGRFWVGTIDDARLPNAGLYRYADGAMTCMADGIVTSNGLAWSPDQKQLYWSDTKAHEIYALDFDVTTGAVGERRVFARFPPRAAGQPLANYGGRPDGAAVDVDGCYWVAMFEGQRLLRLSPEGQVLQDLALPVRCPTMPTFGGPDLRTLYVTTAREKRPAEELAAQPWAGCVLKIRVEIPGLAPCKVRLSA
ncbi:SMP-30/gluconolactonase/LRE family protein [Roseateles koreensis]|uniref:SMP-30/gluconolactonase/LRE family protein n=1 Tax=Roseateles koreensis TaxID=2987526 RepID=A0ABT5KSW9_9BURK|nr:SMP-30/gluconolactonase/LRE family protein [Roseateles koreensis]MDC8784956.1 SMP-30/gluconolactonase/LRE family protein [Roseateles koreensis]